MNETRESKTSAPQPDAGQGRHNGVGHPNRNGVEQRRLRVRIWQALVLWFLLMLPLAFWGLPTTRNDDLLFGGEEAWPAERYRVDQDLAKRQDRVGGADTDLDPIADRRGIVNLTETDADRAAILRRYRLFTRQPDEMITMMALQRMKPHEMDFDPRLYQYGGAYIYLIGAALAVAKALGLLTVTSDVSVYLAKPELFAGFFVIARLITLLFGALTLAAVVRLAQRAGGRKAGWIALALVACSPVFITGVLEAKPHLPCVCLLLWAILFAIDFLTKQRVKDAIRLGLAAGYAFGLVLTGLAGAILWPMLWLLRRKPAGLRGRHLLLGGLVAVIVFAVTNPYPLYNALFDRAALFGNVDNSTAMYRIGNIGAGAARVGQLLLECCGPVGLLLGVIGFFHCLRRWPRRTLLVISPAAAMLVLCVCIGAGKPAEFARFLLLPTIVLLVGGAVFLAALASRRRAWGTFAFILSLALMRTPAYVHAFYLDSHTAHESRRLAGLYIQEHVPIGEPIGVVQEPAPYSVPPMDFARREVRLLPREDPTRHDFLQLPRWIVLTADDETVYRGAWWYSEYRLETSFAASAWELSRIAWANKPVYLYRLAETTKSDKVTR